MRRISVVGPTGSGKTTVAAAVGARLGIPVVEMDALHWGPGWQMRDRDTIRAEVAEAVAGGAWVVDGNYRSVSQDLVWAAADTVVWLDLPFRTNLWRLLRRTRRRVRGREELWAGNRETFRKAFCSRDSILWWLVRTHRRTNARYARDAASGEWSHLRWVRLRTPAEVRAWLEGLG
ncbi:MAG: AAA family ATPase [Actinobacteria bacterium]|nr:AAA family ATPase [Actinomycetota bacterium]